MIILDVVQLLAEAKGGCDFQLHFRPIFCIPAPALRFPIDRHGKGLVAGELLHILANTVGIAIFLGFKFSAYLVAELESDALIHHRLPPQHIPIIVYRDVDVRKDLLIRLPVEHRTGFSTPVRGLLFQSALVSALFKVQVIAEAVPTDGGIKKFRSILGGTGAKAV